MVTVQRLRDRGRLNATRQLRMIGTELRDARLAAGISQQRVAKAAGLSQSRISRTERALSIFPRLDELALHAAVLGSRLSLKTYPEGSPVRDAAQLALLERLRSRVSRSFVWRSEVPIGGTRDLRAWDVQLDGPASIGIDAETSLHDIQALQRRLETKWRDSGVNRLLLVVSGTNRNRRVLAEHREALRSTLPADTHESLAALRAGRLPVANGIILL